MNARERRIAYRAGLACYLEHHWSRVPTVRARHPFTAKWTDARVTAWDSERVGLVGIRFAGEKRSSIFVSVRGLRRIAAKPAEPTLPTQGDAK